MKHSNTRSMIFLLLFGALISRTLYLLSQNATPPSTHSDSDTINAAFSNLENGMHLNPAEQALSLEAQQRPSLKAQQAYYEQARSSVSTGSTLHLPRHSKKTLELMTQQPPESTLIESLKDIEISCPDKTLARLPNPMKAGIRQQAALIRQALPYTINRELLLRLIRSDKPLNISLVPSSWLKREALNGENPTATYTLSHNKNPIIALEIDTTANFFRLWRSLANELYHAAIRGSNDKKLNVEAKLTLSDPKNFIHLLKPFLQQDGQIDRKKLNALSSALKLGFDRIHILHSQHKTHLKKTQRKSASVLEKTISKNLRDFYAALKPYPPHTHFEELPRPTLETLVPHLTATKNGQFILPGPDGKKGYIHSIHHFPGNPPTSQVDYTFARSDHPKHKAAAFFREMSDMKDLMQDAYTRVQESAQNPEGMQEMELSSFIHELTPGLRELLFPEWCAYHDEELDLTHFCRL